MMGVLLLAGFFLATGQAAGAVPQSVGWPQTHRLVVLVDMSGSMSTAGGFLVPGSAEGPDLRWVTQIENALTGAFAPDQSVEVLVGTFSNEISLSERWSTTPADGVRDLRRILQLGGRSPVIDAISSALDRFEGSPSFPKAIAVITDGFNTGNRLRAAGVVGRAISMGVQINTMVRSHGEQAGPATQRAQQWFAEISRSTGGTHFVCETARLETVCSPGGSLKDGLGLIVRALLNSK